MLAPLVLPHPAPPPPQAVEEEDVPKQKEQTHFTVRLTEAKPVDKVKLIKEIKNYVQGINLVQVSAGPLRAGWVREPGGVRRLTQPSALRRRRSWWSRCPRKSKPTSQRPRRRRSRRRWRRWAAPWSWSRLPENCGQGPWDPGEARPPRPAPRLS